MWMHINQKTKHLWTFPGSLFGKSTISIRALSRMSMLVASTSESPQFTNLDNSRDIADRIGELFVVDSYYALWRFDILLR